MSEISRCKECGRLLPIRLSWSQIRTAEECRQKGFLQRSGFRASLQDQRNFFPGTVVDRIERDWLMNMDPADNPGWMAGVAAEYIDREYDKIVSKGGKMTWKSPTDRDDVIATVIEACTALEPILFEKVVPFEYEAALRFKTPLMLPAPDGSMEMIYLSGETDIHVRDDKGDWRIYDLKVTRDDSYWRKVLGQLSFYDLSNWAMFGAHTVETGLIQPLATQKFKPFFIGEDLQAQILQRTMRLASDIWADNFPLNPTTEHCRYCDVKHACVRFKPTVSASGRKKIKLL